ncbi:MAG: RsmB/NOP family class I SAM-dependent RNA methyltransferase [Candidatus Micrarchaeia archaeon]
MTKERFPKEYLEKYSAILGSEFDRFIHSFDSRAKKTIWCNSLCITPKGLCEELAGRDFRLSPLEFSENAFQIDSGPERPGQDEAFAQGRFNLQEKASMLPAIALGARPGERILDAFAAPGNKTLQLCCLCNNEAEITCLERDPTRIGTLRFNTRKFGMRIDAKKLDFQKFKDYEGFDRMLLDAPCSSEGMARKRLDALSEWSEKKVANMSKRQKKAIVRGFDLLKTGGTLVYSTCSLSPEEDEEVIDHLLSSRDGAKVEKTKIAGVNASKGIPEYKEKEYAGQVQNCSRLYPHEWDCQPFFLARVSKQK